MNGTKLVMPNCLYVYTHHQDSHNYISHNFAIQIAIFGMSKKRKWNKSYVGFGLHALLKKTELSDHSVCCVIQSKTIPRFNEMIEKRQQQKNH